MKKNQFDIPTPVGGGGVFQKMAITPKNSDPNNNDTNCS